MPYPSVVASLTNPNPNDRLSTVPHSSIESAQNTEIIAIENFVGTISSTVGTLVYDIRSANSGGGGHVQVANKGGTGQTSYIKGDWLLASSSSVLSKLSIGTDGTSPVADSSQSTGVSWSKVSANLPYAIDSGTGSVYQIAPVPCVVSLSDGQIFVMNTNRANTVTSPGLSVSSLVAKPIKNADGTSLKVGQIQSSTLTILGYNSSQSFFGVIAPSSPSFNFGVITLPNNQDSSTIGISHGLGKIPKYIKAKADFIYGPNSAIWCSSSGTFDGTNTNSTSFNAKNGSGETSPSQSNFLYLSGTHGTQIFTAALTATNINLTNVKGGNGLANNGESIDVLWEAYG